LWKVTLGGDHQWSRLLISCTVNYTIYNTTMSTIGQCMRGCQGRGMTSFYIVSVNSIDFRVCHISRKQVMQMTNYLIKWLLCQHSVSNWPRSVLRIRRYSHMEPLHASESSPRETHGRRADDWTGAKRGSLAQGGICPTRFYMRHSCRWRWLPPAYHTFYL